MRGRKLLAAMAVSIGATFVVTGSAGAASPDRDVQAELVRLMNIATGQCADLPVSERSVSEVVQEPCTGKPNQVWRVQQVPTSFDFQLVNNENGACMDLLTNGRVVLARCSAKLLSQQWQFVTAGGVPGPLRVVNQLAGQCLEVKDGSLEAGTPLQVSTCVESVEHQVWLRLSATES